MVLMDLDVMAVLLGAAPRSGAKRQLYKLCLQPALNLSITLLYRFIFNFSVIFEKDSFQQPRAEGA